MLQPPKTEHPISTIECIGVIALIALLIISISVRYYVCIVNKKNRRNIQLDNTGMSAARNNYHLVKDNEIKFTHINSLDTH
ncbi:hypothetical protein NEPAR06_0024 [Nematocida parisii]|uniref:Uncharacterized protein n=1 Tax=Nematocida parisii (strain ERTm3) TaxID=935791 RepID=I3EGQ4_NEMP3|nr:uncharacterized protein NEPG_00177 [Nematocida parisii ERTm1]EIJ88401.1 hypothetical protein NEQG_01091 [Nematocida parisii ERTm3]KAI5145970.1 hypothetical protein NEPAR07_1996 [Nematocida parisii]EIJ94654.1 hypothetical protein NEPG_00177 [Nematocida parisii ERTm1]KAI5152903.1 hypothetical protein NEPAR06_0024 [Nematocida parisii]KAI5157902.1 hypothetical protein NEPAR05_1686 [Nematocida parisii]|eukprot:XP_013058010.1 hypothetical protein NEPG_00177 [Nematocida parisii ERTm1]